LVVVTALSRRLVVEVHRVGRRWRQEFARGVAVTPLDDAGTSLSAGTTITFWPDPDIFQATQTFSFDALATRLDELAGLNAGLNIVLRDGRDKPATVSRSHYPDGLAGFLRAFGEGTPPVHPTVLHAVNRTAESWVEVAFRWHQDIDEALYSFANGHHTVLGGPHVTGFRSAVTRAVRAVLRRRPEATMRRELPTGDMIRAGLRAVISVNLLQPRFAGATRDRLASPEAEGIVHALTRRCLEAFFREHPVEAEAIVQHALTNPSTNPNCRRPR
jgi:DNA gyrase subunit B